MDELMAAFKSANIQDRDTLLNTFGEILGTDKNTAQFFLEASDWNVEAAVNAFLSSVGSSGNMVAAKPEATFLGDASITSQREFQCGEEIRMNWAIQNSGTTSWPGDARLVQADGYEITAQKVFEVGSVPLGGLFNPEIVMVCPPSPGQYSATWSMHSSQGFFGDQICIIISVVGPPLQQQQQQIQFGAMVSEPGVGPIPTPPQNAFGLNMDQTFDLGEDGTMDEDDL